MIAEHIHKLIKVHKITNFSVVVFLYRFVYFAVWYQCQTACRAKSKLLLGNIAGVDDIINPWLRMYVLMLACGRKLAHCLYLAIPVNRALETFKILIMNVGLDENNTG